MLSSRFRGLIYPVGLMSICSGMASAQTYPDKVIRIAVSAPGGGSDFTARMVSQISTSIGQPVIVEYRGAAILTPDFVSKAPPDGYTLLVSGAILWLAPLLMKTPFDAVKDFLPISLLVREINVIAVHPSVPVKSVSELVTLAKAKPGALNYSTPGNGTTQHLAMELFKSMAGINLVHVPYKGGAPSIAAVLGGEAQLTITDVANVSAHGKAGKLRALAVTSAEPSPLAPGLPTIAASGVPGYEAVSMTGMFAPAKTPEATIRRLNQEAVRVFNLPETKEKFLNIGAEVVASSPDQFAVIIKSEITKMSKVIKDAGLVTN